MNYSYNMLVSVVLLFFASKPTWNTLADKHQSQFNPVIELLRTRGSAQAYSAENCKITLGEMEYLAEILNIYASTSRGPESTRDSLEVPPPPMVYEVNECQEALHDVIITIREIFKLERNIKASIRLYFKDDIVYYTRQTRKMLQTITYKFQGQLNQVRHLATEEARVKIRNVVVGHLSCGTERIDPLQFDSIIHVLN